MPRADRKTGLSPGQAAVRQAGLAAPAGNRSRHRVTGADVGAVDDRQLRGWLTVVAGNSRTPSSTPMGSSTAATCRGCPDGAGDGEPPAASALVLGGREDGLPAHHGPRLSARAARGPGDTAAGIAAPLVARRLAQGTGRRAALWFNAFGMTGLVVSLTLGALTGFRLINVTRRGRRSASSRSR
jgi:hypothetical protein